MPLQANNTVIVGLPVMNATFPEVGGPVALLTGACMDYTAY